MSSNNLSVGTISHHFSLFSLFITQISTITRSAQNIIHIQYDKIEYAFANVDLRIRMEGILHESQGVIKSNQNTEMELLEGTVYE